MNSGRSPLRLSVRTESGQPLGQVVDVMIEPETQSVIAYHVKPMRLLPNAVHPPLIIHRSQVVHFTAEAMIVDDAVLKRPSASVVPQPSV